MGVMLENVAFTVNLLLDMIGAALFIALLHVTIKYKKLHANHCLKLIAVYFLCCLGSKLIILLPYLIKVIPLSVPLHLCVAIQFVPMSLTNSLAPFTAIIAIDRLISVFFPIWYKKERLIVYVPILCTIAAIYPAYMATFMIKNVIQNSMIPTNCTTGKLYGRSLPSDWSWGFTGIAIMCYGTMFVKLACKRLDGRRAYFKHQPIFKSLSLIISIQIGAWLFTMASYRYGIKLFSNLPQDQIPLVYYVVNYFSSLATTAEVPAIYFTSKEHRLALRREFGCLFRLFSRISPLNSVVIINSGERNPAPAAAPPNIQVVVVLAAPPSK